MGGQERKVNNNLFHSLKDAGKRLKTRYESLSRKARKDFDATGDTMAQKVEEAQSVRDLKETEDTAVKLFQLHMGAVTEEEEYLLRASFRTLMLDELEMAGVESPA